MKDQEVLTYSNTQYFMINILYRVIQNYMSFLLAYEPVTDYTTDLLTLVECTKNLDILVFNVTTSVRSTYLQAG